MVVFETIGGDRTIAILSALDYFRQERGTKIKGKKNLVITDPPVKREFRGRKQ